MQVGIYSIWNVDDSYENLVRLSVLASRIDRDLVEKSNYRPAEDGRPKCVVYWPQQKDEKLEFPSLLVTNLEEESDQFSTMKLQIELNPSFGRTHLFQDVLEFFFR